MRTDALALLLSLRALRGLAPTRVRRAGAAAGLFAGVAHALAGTETQAPCLAVWYGTGMVLPMVLGAWVAPRWLHW